MLHLVCSRGNIKDSKKKIKTFEHYENGIFYSIICDKLIKWGIKKQYIILLS